MCGLRAVSALVACAALARVLLLLGDHHRRLVDLPGRRDVEETLAVPLVRQDELLVRGEGGDDLPNLLVPLVAGV